MLQPLQTPRHCASFDRVLVLELDLMDSRLALVEVAAGGFANEEHAVVSVPTL